MMNHQEEKEEAQTLLEEEQEEVSETEEIEGLGNEVEKRKRRKKKKKSGNKKKSGRKNGFEGIPFEQTRNELPEHPDLYENHPRAIHYSQQELNKILPASMPVNLRNTPYVVCGFLTPRTVIKKIEMFRFEHFVRHYPFMKASYSVYKGMGYLANQFGIPIQEVERCYDTVMKVEMEELLQLGAEHEYEMFVTTYREELDKIFKEKYGFQPTSELFKIFDAFATEEEADKFIINSKKHLGSKYMRLFTGDVREMLCFDPEDRDVQNKKYINQEVAQLMQQNNRNHKKRLDSFEQRMSRRILDQYHQNEKLAKETGQTMTMKVNEKGKIVESMKEKVFADLKNREAKPTAPPSSQLAAAGAKGGMVEVAQCIETTDLKTGEKKTDVYIGQDATYSKF